MIMKINNSAIPSLFAPALDGRARTPTEKPAGNAPSSVPGGTAGSGGTTFSRVHSLGNTASAPIDTSKLAEIKQAISEGRFQVNPGAVAEGLIKSVADLIAAQ